MNQMWNGSCWLMWEIKGVSWSCFKERKFCMLCSCKKTSCERQLMWLDQWDQEWKDLSERQLVWLDQRDQERDNCSKISEILFDQWGQMWETIVVRSVRSCRSVRSSGGLVLQGGAEPLRQIWVQWEHPTEGDLFCGCRLRPNHVRSCVCDCTIVGIGVHVVLWGAYLVDSAFLRLMQERVEEW